MKEMMRTKRIVRLTVLVLIMMIGARRAHAQSLPFSGTLVSDTALVLDSNAPCVDGPRSGYVAFSLINNGAARTGVYVELGGFANGLALSTNQAARQYVGNWAAGATKTFYWFIAYPCTFGSSSNLDVHIVDSTGSSADVIKRVVTKSMLSSNGGGQLVAGSVGPGAVVGQTLTVDVQYQFGGVSAGDTYSMQASGTIALNAQCFQLAKTEIVQSDITAVPVGTVDKMFFTASARQSGSGYTATMRYYFKYLCMGQQSYLQPYTNQYSGGQLKYSGNWGSFIGPTLPSAANGFTVTKTMTPTVMPSSGTVTYTVTVNNTSAFAAAVDSVMDQLPSGITYGALTAASTVTAANSSSVPATGATGTVVFRGPWDVAAGSSLRVVYTATVTSTPGTYTNGANAYTGISMVGGGNASVTVGQADLRATKTGPTTAFTSDSIKYALRLYNAGPQSASNAILIDTLPSGVTFLRATRSPTLSGRVLTWPAIASLANGSAVVDTVVVRAPGTAGTLTNVVAATSSTYDPDASSNNGSLSNARVTTTVSAAATDLTVAKVASNSFTVGSNGIYTITVTNQGSTSSGNIVVTDTLPAGLTYVSGSGTGWTFSATGQVVTATYSGAALATSGTAAFTLTASLSAAALPSVTNRAWVSGGGDANATNNGSGNVVTALTGVIDLSISKTSDASFTQGVNGNYTIAVTNAGSASTSGTITVRDTLPTGLTYVSASGTGWTITQNLGAITATYAAALAPAATASFNIVVSPQAAAQPSVTNKAVVSGGGQTAYLANDTARVTTPVSGLVDLTLTKTSSTFQQYGTGTYTLTVTNAGTGATTGNTVVTDTLPSYIASATGSGSGWSFAIVGQIVTATYSAAIAGGASTSFTLNVTLSAPTTAITNRAWVSNAGDSNTGNNSASVTTSVTQMPDLQPFKSSSASFTPGSTGTYSIYVQNNGFATSSGTITVTDTLPAGITYTSFTGSNWTVSYASATRVVTATYNLALNIAAVTPTLTLNVNIASTVAPPVTNTAWVSGGNDPNAANNNASVTTPLNGADLRITKTSTSFTPGSTGTYTFTIDNIGTGSSSGNIVVTDTMPAGLTVSSVSSPQNGFTITSAVASNGRYVITATRSTVLAPAATTSFTQLVSVTTAAMPSVSNKVYLANPNQINPANDTSRLVTAVASPDVTITKAANGTFTAGYAATYTITITNSGGYTTSGNIVVNDVLPSGLTFNAAGSSGTSWTITNSGQTVTATYTGTLAASASSSFTLGVNVAESAPGSVQNTATVTGGNDQNTSNNSSGSIDTPITYGSPSLTLVKSVAPAGNPRPGDVITYSITALNSGNASGVNVIIQDSIPSQLQFKIGTVTNTVPPAVTVTVDYYGPAGWGYTPVSAGCSAPAGFDACARKVKWTLSSLPISASATVTFNARVK